MKINPAEITTRKKNFADRPSYVRQRVTAYQDLLRSEQERLESCTLPRNTRLLFAFQLAVNAGITALDAKICEIEKEACTDERTAEKADHCTKSHCCHCLSPKA